MSVGVPPFPIEHELAGWELFWVLLEVVEGAEEDGRLAALLRETSELARAALEGIDLASHATVAAMRKLFRAAGTDPTRYRPASEALLRRVLKGEDLPAIHPLVDINNCLSIELAVPCCVAAEGRSPRRWSCAPAGPERATSRCAGRSTWKASPSSSTPKGRSTRRSPAASG